MPSPRFHPLVRLIIYVTGAALAAVIVLTVVAIATAVAAQLNGLPPQQQIAQFFEQYALLATLLTYPPTLLWLWFCRRVFDRRSFVSLGLRARRSVRDFFLGSASGVAAISFLFGVLWLTGHVVIIGWSPESDTVGFLQTYSALTLWAVVFLAVGFMEEVQFRGYGLHNLAAWLGTPSAVMLQAIIFASVHLGNIGFHSAASDGSSPTPEIAAAFSDALRAMPNITLIGIFFALCYLKTGSLWFPIGFHAAWNFFLGCVFSLPVSGIKLFRLFEVSATGSTWVTGGSFGLEGSILLLPILAALIYLMLRSPAHPQAALDLALLCKTPATVGEGVLTQTEETAEEPQLTRFKTSMRPKEENLSPETISALRALNEARKQSSLAASSAPPKSMPAESPIPSWSTVGNSSETVVAPEASIPTSTAAPESVPLQEQDETAAAMPSPASTPAVSAPDSAQQPEYSPAPATRTEPAPSIPSSTPPAPAPAPRKPPAPRW